MDTNLLMASFFFGVIGMGLCAYGRRASNVVSMIAGFALMAVPFFITNLLVMILVCSALTVSPWLLRDG